ncbi:MAG: polymer-forming cytoskeletal protein [Cyanobacteria bacterium P01_A01_bin.123]
MFGRRQQRYSAGSLTYVGAGSQFQGDLKVDGNLRVDGTIYGDVWVTGDLEIAADGKVEGLELQANNIVVHGKAKARIAAAGKLSLSRTAQIEGDVTANALDIEAGAFYVGHITTTDSQQLTGSPPPLSLAGTPESSASSNRLGL